jgi:hypothetical protein
MIELSDYENIVELSLNYKTTVAKQVQGTVTVDYLRPETEEDKARKNSLFEHYLEVNKNLTFEEIDKKIESGRKSNYDDYTEESKMEYRALKTLQEKIQNENFRNFFIERKFLTDKISSKELNNQINNIQYRISLYKMEAIPEDIVNEAKKIVLEKEFEEYKILLTSKTILQLKNWMEKRKDEVFPPKIEEYYTYRLEKEEEEYQLTKELTRLKNNISQNAKIGEVEKVREYEILLVENTKKLENLKSSFFDFEN